MMMIDHRRAMERAEMILMPFVGAMLLAAGPMAIGRAPLPQVIAVAIPVSTGAADELPADLSDIVVTARKRTAADPLERVNATTFAATQAVDGAVVAPVALAYAHAVPAPVRSGVRNFIANLREPVVFANYLLQLKPGKAAETLGRFAINTTVGAAGLVDMAKRKPFRLPPRPNGFANTLGYYGVKPGAFLFLPLIGPTTVRDLFGSGFDRVMQRFSYIRPFNRLAYVLPSSALRTLDRRAELDDQFRAIRESSDPYVTRRDAYLRRRRAKIGALHGRPADASD